MVAAAAKRLLGQALIASRALGTVTASASEKYELAKCLKEIDLKRQAALKKIARNRKLGTHLTTLTEDDKYALDSYYQKKLQECYDRNTRLRKAGLG